MESEMGEKGDDGNEKVETREVTSRKYWIANARIRRRASRAWTA